MKRFFRFIMKLFVIVLVIIALILLCYIGFGTMAASTTVATASATAAAGTLAAGFFGAVAALGAFFSGLTIGALIQLMLLTAFILFVITDLLLEDDSKMKNLGGKIVDSVKNAGSKLVTMAKQGVATVKNHISPSGSGLVGTLFKGGLIVGSFFLGKLTCSFYKT